MTVNTVEELESGRQCIAIGLHTESLESSLQAFQRAQMHDDDEKIGHIPLQPELVTEVLNKLLSILSLVLGVLIYGLPVNP